MKYEASKLITLLKLKHAEDVFVPECKDGPSHVSHFRLDGWAMQKSWSHPTTYGYECKVARNDFLRDNKWQNYLELCSDFYFVCPWGLIQPEEVGDPAGLLWAANNGGERLWVKKKAKRRADVVIPEALWRYILMRLDRPTIFDNGESWKRWLAQDDAEKEIGHKVSNKIRQLVSERITTVEIENHKLQKEIAKYAEIKAVMEDLKISPFSYDVKRAVAEQIERTKELFSPEVMREVNRLRERLDGFIKLGGSWDE